MITSGQLRRCAGALMLGLLAGVPAVRAQSSAEPSTKAIAKTEPSDPKRAKLLADTRRMLALSREVQAEMVKNGTDTLSLGMVKKVEELQKLAAVVKAELAKTP